MEIKGLRNRFKEIYGREAADAFFAPGRVNLIGEHTDYNGGHVFPAALTMGVTLLIAPRADKKMCYYSVNFEHLKIIKTDLEHLEQKKENGWVNYLTGAVAALKERSYNINAGFDLLIYGNIPNGAGLSSSAALGVVFVTAMNALNGFGLDGVGCALIAQRAEHLTGMMCGIMDQFASAMGKKDHAIFLDCASLSYEYVPVILGDYALMIMDSRKKHALNESKYNERRTQCEEAVKMLQAQKKIKALGELSEEEFSKLQHLLPETIRKRARHAVTENARTLKSLQALKAGRLQEFGQYLNESHYSMRDDYEVSCMETDSLTAAARSYPGVLGSRMTGGGFGGSCIALIKKGTETDFTKAVSQRYFEDTGIQAQLYLSQIGNGAGRL